MSDSAGGLQIRAASHTSREHIITGKKRAFFAPILTIVTIMLALSLAARYACLGAVAMAARQIRPRDHENPEPCRGAVDPRRGGMA